jgi:flagellar protein FlaG
MIVNTNNDDSKLINISQTSNANNSSVKRVSPAVEVSSAQNDPENGNNLPVNAVATEPSIGLQAATDPEKLEEAVQKINESIQLSQREIRFSIDKDSGKTVVKIMDLSTNEVVRQIPNAEALSLARKLAEGADLKIFSGYS